MSDDLDDDLSGPQKGVKYGEDASINAQTEAWLALDSSSSQRDIIEARNALLKSQGYTQTGKVRGGQGNTAKQRELAAKAAEYAPIVGLQLDLNLKTLSDIAVRFENAGAELKRFKDSLSMLAKASLDETANIAMAEIDRDRKRKGWAERAAYKDRGGTHHLREAIWKSRIITEVGNGYEFVGFDENVLNRETFPGKKHGVGYWKEYELGSRGGFNMPRGIWVGPSGFQPTASGIEYNRNDKGQVTGSYRTNANHGQDRFYPSAGGAVGGDRYGNESHHSKKFNEVRTNAGVYASQKPHPVLGPALQKMGDKIAKQLHEAWNDYLVKFEEMDGGGIHVQGNGSIASNPNQV